MSTPDYTPIDANAPSLAKAKNVVDNAPVIVSYHPLSIADRLSEVLSP